MSEVKKIETVLVTAERQRTRHKTTVGTCIKGVTFTPNQCETIKEYLAKKFGRVADLIVVSTFENRVVMMWIEVRFDLSVKRELRRFCRALERIGVTEKAVPCSPLLA